MTGVGAMSIWNAQGHVECPRGWRGLWPYTASYFRGTTRTILQPRHASGLRPRLLPGDLQVLRQEIRQAFQVNGAPGIGIAPRVLKRLTAGLVGKEHGRRLAVLSSRCVRPLVIAICSSGDFLP